MSDERFDRIEAALHDLTVSNHTLTVLGEDTNSRVRLLAEGLAATNERMDRGFAEIGTRIDGTNQMMRTFIRQQAQANRQVRESLSNDGARLRGPKRRRRTR